MIENAEKSFKCDNCDARVTESQQQTVEGKYEVYRCPKCGALHDKAVIDISGRMR